MTKTSVTLSALMVCLSAVPLMVGMPGCASGRHIQSSGGRFDAPLSAEPAHLQSTDQGIEDSRTAERVRETLAAGADYKYDGVKVTADKGVVQLFGFVNTSAQRTRAGEITRKVVGVKSVENNLTLKD
jgi:hyperosmotically inducible periplasmic protein